MSDFGATWLPAGAGNYLIGRAGVAVDRIVCHHTAGFLTPSINQFTTPGTMVSAHFMVAQDGTVYQFVDLGDTAFHSGNFAMNQRSVGIEHVSMPPAGGDEFTDLEYDSSRPLIRQIAAQFGFPVDDTHVIPHRDVVLTECPGSLDLARLIAPPPVPPQPKEDEMAAVAVPPKTVVWFPRPLSPNSTISLIAQGDGDVHGQTILYASAPGGSTPLAGAPRLHFDLPGNNPPGSMGPGGTSYTAGWALSPWPGNASIIAAVENDGPGTVLVEVVP